MPSDALHALSANNRDVRSCGSESAFRRIPNTNPPLRSRNQPNLGKLASSFYSGKNGLQISPACIRANTKIEQFSKGTPPLLLIRGGVRGIRWYHRLWHKKERTPPNSSQFWSAETSELKGKSSFLRSRKRAQAESSSSLVFEEVAFLP